MDELNGCDPIEIKVPSPYTFTIGDTTKMAAYVSGGVATQVICYRGLIVALLKFGGF